MKTILNVKSFVSAFTFFVLVLNANTQTTHDVEVKSNSFTPSELTIKVGDSVKWTNVAGTHNVNGTQATYPSNPLSFGNSVGSGWTYSFKFTAAGTYDYHCNPHVGFGMKGKIIVIEDGTVTVNLTGMTPHVGQDLSLAIIEKNSKKEVFRKKTLVTETFSVASQKIESGKAYFVDFFADFNENGYYDFPADHSWRLEIDDLKGDTVLDFAHNTNFTDIKWKHKLTVNFSEMSPHTDQKLSLFLKELSSDKYVDTIIVNKVSPTFSIESFSIAPMKNYNIDFYADHNGNGKYDPPNADHAWRLKLMNVRGDTTLDFKHNVDFTDIFPGTALVGDIGAHALKLYPIPVSDRLTISLGNRTSGADVEIFVYDLSGKNVLQQFSSNVTEEITINLNTINSGVYFVKLRSENFNEVLQFVKK